MKLRGQTIVMVPWFDSDGMKQWVRMTFRGEMDSRFMYKQIRLWIKKEFKKHVDKKWIKANCSIINEYLDENGKEKNQPLSDDAAFDQLVEDWIKRLESYEDEDESDTVLSKENTGDSEEPVRPVSDSDKRS